MTGKHHRLDDAALAGLDGIVPARDRAEPEPLAGAMPTNVVPFMRPRHQPSGDAAPAVDAAQRPAPQFGTRETHTRIAALVAVSLLAHIGLYLLTNREPEPMASVGLEAISVELMLGTNSPAGVAAAPSENETQTAPTEVQQTEPDKTEVQETKPPDQVAAVDPEQAKEQPQPPDAQQVAPTETAQRPPEHSQTQEPPQSAPVAEAPAEQANQAPPAETPVMPVPPRTEAKAETPTPPKPVPPKPEPKVATKPKPAPKREVKTAPKRDTTPRRETPRGKTANRTDNPGPRSNASNGAGAGRSANMANYRGQVAAHLARYKRFPPEAQRAGTQGVATVSFTLSGSGSVGGVSLVRGTGIGALDQEVVAMVRRASPFPAPPDGRPQRFTVPVSYKMR